MIYTIITLCKQTFPWVHFRFLFSSLRKDMIHIASTQQDGQVAFVWQEFISKPALSFWANFSFPILSSLYYCIFFFFSHITRSILLYHIQHAALLLVGLQDHPSCPNNREGKKSYRERVEVLCLEARIYVLAAAWQLWKSWDAFIILARHATGSKSTVELPNFPQKTFQILAYPLDVAPSNLCQQIQWKTLMVKDKIWNYWNSTFLFE